MGIKIAISMILAGLFVGMFYLFGCFIAWQWIVGTITLRIVIVLWVMVTLALMCDA